MRILTRGYDFYAAPRLNQIGNQIAWICWSHPQMPWDGTELWLVDLTLIPELTNACKIIGGVDEFVPQSSFSCNGKLCFFLIKADLEIFIIMTMKDSNMMNKKGCLCNI